jgi:voltage-dependent potassium channel beta subunit
MTSVINNKHETVPMEYQYLGNSGLLVSRLSYGTWVNFTETEKENGDELVNKSYELMKAAFVRGCNFFDNAEVYGRGASEIIMGKVVKRFIEEGLCIRSDLVLSTKLYWGKSTAPNASGLSRKHIMEGMDASLERAGLKYYDLVFCHRPERFTPLEETVRAMNDLIVQGKAFYWGTSEWPADMIAQAYEIANRHGWHKPIMEQPQYNLLHRKRVESEYERLYNEMKLGLTIWSPLASGLLTGKYKRLDSESDLPENSRLAQNHTGYLRDGLFDDSRGLNGLEEKNRYVILEKVDKLKPIAEKLECSLSVLAIAWCLKNSNVSTVITGASRVEQVEDNFTAIQVYKKLTDDIMKEIEQIIDNKPDAIWRDFKNPIVFPPTNK